MTLPHSHSFVAAAAISELQSLVNSSGGSTGHNCEEGAIACDSTAITVQLNDHDVYNSSELE